MRLGVLTSLLVFTLACGGTDPATDEGLVPILADCPAWRPLTGESIVQPTGWTLPIPEGVELVDVSSAPLTHYIWEHPYDGGVASFQFLYGEVVPIVPLEEWTTRQTQQQENLGRTVEVTTVGLDGATFTALRYAQGFTHGIEIAYAIEDGFRSVTLDVQGTDARCAPRARETLDAILDGITRP